MNPRPLNCTHHARLYPQNGYHLVKLVTIDCCDVTSPNVLLLLLLKSVEFDDDVALLSSVAGLVMGPQVISESEIGSTDSAALRTSRACLRLCGNCVASCTSCSIQCGITETKPNVTNVASDSFSSISDLFS